MSSNKKTKERSVKRSRTMSPLPYIWPDAVALPLPPQPPCPRCGSAMNRIALEEEIRDARRRVVAVVQALAWRCEVKCGMIIEPVKVMAPTRDEHGKPLKGPPRIIIWDACPVDS